MRTTIDINDALYRKIKVTAALNGLSLKEFITRAVEHELESSGPEFEGRRVRLPLIPSENPGSLVLDSDSIAAVLEREDFYAAT
ncbi:MAG: hypothetical protein ACLFRY_15840 [Spirochaetia bacterium]